MDVRAAQIKILVCPWADGDTAVGVTWRGKVLPALLEP